ncbi:MAG: hypothetical protein KDA51_03060, partial [Planctomycetales bacterium]|nr:hypothetical protein [Planctomycetales bacterium]
DAANHEKMVHIRAQKVANVAKIIPPQEVIGPSEGELLVLSWGGTYGSCRTAVLKAIEEGRSVAHCHLRHMNPFPSNLGQILGNYESVLIPELNLGQLRMLIRAKYLIDAVGYNRVQGKPFSVTELVEKIAEMTSDQQKSANGKLTSRAG